MPHFKTIVLALMAMLAITTAEAQEGARITADELTYNFGTIAEADGLASHVFTIRNSGGATLVLSRVPVWCGCTRPEWPERTPRPLL